MMNEKRVAGLGTPAVHSAFIIPHSSFGGASP
jgi:hypothetical protein